MKMSFVMSTLTSETFKGLDPCKKRCGKENEEEFERICKEVDREQRIKESRCCRPDKNDE